jgi:2-polyprenyl-6-methoxyphenol hydroxylase-like FAD-dependent oxidoreductase
MATATGPGRGIQQQLGHRMSTETASTVFSSKWAETMPQRCMQSTQEACLKEHAEQCPHIKVHYGYELIAFEDSTEPDQLGQSQKSVTAVIKNVTSNDVVYIKCKYLVGCDGPSSFVSKTLQVKFDGYANLGQTRTIHIQSKGLLSKIRPKLGEALQYHISRPGFGVGWFVCNYFPTTEQAENEHEKWTFFLMGLLDGRQPRQLSNEDMIAVVHEFIGPDIDFDVVADAPWYWNLFFARRYVYNNIIICGDACHSWPPFGGIGGNTGYGDAQNLGWKLASVVHGWGHELNMLTSYDHERRQFGLKTIMVVLNFAPDRSQILRLAILAKYEYLWWTFRYRWMFASRGAHAGNHYSTDGLFLGIQYHSNIIYHNHEQQGIPALESPPSRYSPAIYAGGRLPHLQLSTIEKKLSVYDLLSFEGYTLLVIDPMSIQLKDFHQDSASATTSSSKNIDVEAQNHILDAPIILKFQEYFQKRRIPLKVVNLGLYFSEISQSTIPEEILLYKLYQNQHLILVRPDFIITWFLSKAAVAKSKGNTVISVFEVLKVAKIACGEIVDDEMMQRNKHRDDWLTRRFISNIQGYRHLHKQAIYFENEVRVARS